MCVFYIKKTFKFGNRKPQNAFHMQFNHITKTFQAIVKVSSSLTSFDYTALNQRVLHCLDFLHSFLDH